MIRCARVAHPLRARSRPPPRRSYIIHDAILGTVLLFGSISLFLLGPEKTQKWTGPLYTGGITLVAAYLVYALGSGVLEYNAEVAAEQAANGDEVAEVAVISTEE